jgi:leucyl/phenylalanyl-tRNA--protein transferase
MTNPITPQLLLTAYANGLFPMAERRDDPTLFWVSPEMRGILPLDGFHVPKRLARTVRADKFRVTADVCFERVIAACAAPGKGREETWINDKIFRLYTELHDLGFAHSIESWSGEDLVGGLYGVSLYGAFFGESMFSRTTDASKVALVHLTARLKLGGYRLLDTQFLTDHLAQFGAVEIPRADYLHRLDEALKQPAYWPASSGRSGIFSSAPALGEIGATVLAGGALAGTLVMHLIAQTS